MTRVFEKLGNRLLQVENRPDLTARRRYLAQSHEPPNGLSQSRSGES